MKIMETQGSLLDGVQMECLTALLPLSCTLSSIACRSLILGLVECVSHRM